MYTYKGLQRKDAVGRRALNSGGLGDEIQNQYGGQSKSQGIVTKAGSIYSPFTSAVTTIIPKKVLKAVGVDMNPVSMALAPFTFGISMLPGVSQLIGKLFGGFFKKATHMESCMRWWSDSNIRGMASGLTPYSFEFEPYMMKNFPQFLRQYQIKQADGTWASVGVESLLNTSNRQSRIATIFTRIVRENPDIMKLQCASMPQGRAETGYGGEGADKYWAQIKEVARQEEYSTIAEQVDKLVAPWKVKETWGAIVKSRNEQLVVRTDQGSQMKIADNVIGVKRGAFVMTLKTPQGKEERVPVPPKALSGSVPVRTMSW